MRPLRRSLLLSPLFACLASAACGAAPDAVAQPRRPTSPMPAPDDRPLVASALETDADVARAIREHYTKYEYRIPMRDGARLFTAVYVPKDTSRAYPILMTRTPYSVRPYGIDNYPSASEPRTLTKFAPSKHFIRDGYIFVHQDVRGRMMSEGTFVEVRPHAAKKGDIDESTDAWDTIDWLIKNVPNNNGRVGAWGISYPGFYAAQAAVDAHPALKAVSPQAPVTDWFMGDDFHHNGAFFLAEAFDFESNFGRPRPKPTRKIKWDAEHRDGTDVYDFFLGLGPLANADTKYLEGTVPFWNEMLQHPNRDAWWKARDPRAWYRNAKPAVMTVGGWFDKEDLFGALETYRAFEAQSPKSDNTLVMGPWGHGGWARTDGDHLGDVAFGQKTSLDYRERVELPFFQRHLKGRNVAPPAEAVVFETGTNVWQRLPTWPPREAKPVTLHFHARGTLGLTPPTAGEDESGADAYISDPHKPVPYRAGPSSQVEADYMTGDQRFASRRPDVLVYTTGALDADVTLAGPLEASLWVSTTGTDADFVVKIVDVYPDDVADPEPNPRGVKLGGYEQLVRAEVMRGRFRDGFERPRRFDPNEPALVRFGLPDVFHTFRAGHRIMVQVQSTWFPLVDRNPQTFVEDIARATDADFRVATHRVHRTPDKPSSLKVFLARGSLPK